MRVLSIFHGRLLKRNAVVRRLVAPAALLGLVVASGTLAAEEAETPQQPPAKTLESFVSELLQLELEESKEKTAWDEQKGHIDTMTALLQAEIARLEKTIAEVVAKEEEERADCERLTRRIEAMKDSLSKIAKSATKTGQDLLAEYEKLPGPLREKLKAGVQLVRARVNEKGSPENALDRLRTVVAFGHDMQRILSEVHAVKQVIDLDGKQRLEVDVVYLGGTAGFYLAPDRKRAGILKRTEDGWEAVPCNEIAGQVSLALKVKRKEISPTLVRLPLQPPDGKEPERNE